MRLGVAGHGRGDQLVQHAGVGDDHALGVAGRTGGIEHGRRVGRPDGGGPAGDLIRAGGQPRGAERREVRPAQVEIPGRAGGRVPHDDLLQAGQAGQHRLPPGQLVRAVEHGDPRVAVGGHVADLLGGQRGVDRHRHSAGMQGAQVGEHVLDPVRHHQRHPLARLQAERGEPGRERQRLLMGLPPGDGLPRAAVPVGVRGQVAEGLRRGLQLAAERPALGGLLQRPPAAAALRASSCTSARSILGAALGGDDVFGIPGRGDARAQHGDLRAHAAAGEQGGRYCGRNPAAAGRERGHAAADGEVARCLQQVARVALPVRLSG